MTTLLAAILTHDFALGVGVGVVLVYLVSATVTVLLVTHADLR